ncbi:DeoR family transcriptional regulator [Paenibacillus odorifer]|uniref:HTH deoR-type domain-containing protein n=1 Tax=Paenibacillus odorifer TaxID=189426 RepID=A0A1R0XS71_9BACL|nr:DeoR family transcriptional regulator [Paenibacillus odorifer]OMD37915.1 hypothetical protein BSK52_20140 [Paenibacillus odorifer]
MNRLNIQEPSPNPAGSAAVPLIKLDRTGFDYVILAAAYLFMPIGLVLALLRLMLTHYKNYRRPTNLNLLMHVFIGGFVELSIAMFVDTMSGNTGTSELLTIQIFLAVIFLIPAFILASVTAKAKYTLSKLNTSYIELIQNKNIRYVGSIAERIGISENDVRRDVQYLKNKGLLDIDIVLSEGRQTPDPSMTAPNLVHPGRPSGFGAQASGQQVHTQPQSSPQMPKSIRCPGCGAQNTVQPSQSKSCDYCGTMISYS